MAHCCQAPSCNQYMEMARHFIRDYHRTRAKQHAIRNQNQNTKTLQTMTPHLPLSHSYPCTEQPILHNTSSMQTHMDVVAEGTGHARGLIRHMQFVPGETVDKNAACNPILYKVVANFANEDPTLSEDFDKGAIRAVSVVSWNAMENQFYIPTPVHADREDADVHAIARLHELRILRKLPRGDLVHGCTLGE